MAQAAVHRPRLDAVSSSFRHRRRPLTLVLCAALLGPPATSVATADASAPPMIDVVVLDTDGPEPSITSATVSLDTYRELANDGDSSTTVSVDVSLTPFAVDDPARASQWHLDVIDAEAAWATGADGTGVTIGVLDTGVLSTDVAVTASIDIAGGPIDKFTHGSNVASLAAAAANNQQGGAGVAPGATVVSAKVCAGNSCSLDAVTRGLVWAVGQGADVINMSLGGPAGMGVLRRAIQWATDQGVSVVAAAGNTQCSERGDPSFCSDNDNVMYPAAYPEVLAVTATTDDGTSAYWSTKGRRSTVAAPGEMVWFSTNGLYGSVGSGTSYASPIVAGVVALVAQAAPSLTPAERQAAVMLSATPATEPLIRSLPRAWFYGAGHVDALQAVTLARAFDSATEGPPAAVSQDGALDVSWAAVPGATSYSVRTAPGTTATTASTSTTIGGLENGRSYAVQVTASTPGGEVLLRPVIGIPSRPVAAPVLLSANANGAGSGGLAVTVGPAIPEAGLRMEATLDGVSLDWSFLYSDVDGSNNVTQYSAQFYAPHPVSEGTLSVWYVSATGARSPATTRTVSIPRVLPSPADVHIGRNPDGTTSVSWDASLVESVVPDDPAAGSAAEAYWVVAGRQPLMPGGAVTFLTQTVTETSATLDLEEGVVWSLSIRALRNAWPALYSYDTITTLLPLADPLPAPQHVAVAWDPVRRVTEVSFDTNPAFDTISVTSSAMYPNAVGGPIDLGGGRSMVRVSLSQLGVAYGEPVRFCILAEDWMPADAWLRYGDWSTGVSVHAGAAAVSDGDPCGTMNPPSGSPPPPEPGDGPDPTPPDTTVPDTGTPDPGAPDPGAPDPGAPGTPGPTSPVPDTPGAAGADRFEPISPIRFADTRVGGAGSPVVARVPAGGVLRVLVAGVAGVPLDATAVAANVTAVFPATAGYLTVFPCGAPRPLAANVNYSAGSIDANGVFVGLGEGALCVYSMAATDIVVDITGVFVGDARAYEPLTPARLIDTRETHQRLEPGGVLEVQVTGHGGVPSTANAVTVNLTAVAPEAAGYVTLWPCDTARPGTSSLNVAAHDTRPNLVTVKLSADGRLCAFSLSATDLVIDVGGYWSPTGRSTYRSVQPFRVADTREAVPATRLAAGTVLHIPVAGATGAIPAGAVAVAANIAVVSPATDGFVTAWPCDRPRPLTSTGNFTAGSIRPNAAVVTLAGDGSLCVYSMSATDVVVDISGYWT